MQKVKLLGLASVSGCLIMSSLAQADFEAEIGLTSNYLDNGVSQTDNKPALQAGITYSHDSGFYLSGWTSNVLYYDEDDNGDEVKAPQRVEVDAVIGFNYEINENIAVDLSAAQFSYFGKSDADDANYQQYTLGFEFGTGTSVTYSYAPDYFGDDIKHHLLELSQDLELGDYLFNLTLTNSKAEDYDYWAEDHHAYQHARLSVARDWQGFNFELAATGTTIKKSFDDNAKPMATLTITKAWEW